MSEHEFDPAEVFERQEPIFFAGAMWRPVSGVHDYSQEGEWIFESYWNGLGVACGYNDGGPVAWAGLPAEDRWIDSVACDGSFESGARRAMELADDTAVRAMFDLPNYSTC